MTINIYVGNLPYATSEEELNDMFSQYGNVTSAKIIMDRFSGRSKGFGFVEMAEQAEAEKAIEALHGKQVGGRTLKVNEAQAGKRRQGSGRPPYGGGGYNRRY